LSHDRVRAALITNPPVSSAKLEQQLDSRVLHIYDATRLVGRLCIVADYRVLVAFLSKNGFEPDKEFILLGYSLRPKQVGMELDGLQKAAPLLPEPLKVLIHRLVRLLKRCEQVGIVS